MAPVSGPPKLPKNRKMGKGKKKAWRAANVKDIEEFLDDERRQLETGGLVAEKSNEKLFFVDTKKAQKKVQVNKSVSKEDRRNRPLKSTALLEPSPHIKRVIAPVSENHKKGKKPQKILDSLRERARSHVRLQSLKMKEDYVRGKRVLEQQKKRLPEVTTDIWNDGEMDTAKVKRPKRLLGKPSRLNATAIPHSGASINPSFDDHQELLQKALEVEQVKRKKAIRIVNALKLPVDKSEVATPATYLAEMSGGLIESESENDAEGGEEDSDTQSSIRMPQRKTKRQRKAEVKQGEMTRSKKAEAERKIRENMVFRLRGLNSEIRKKDEISKAKSEAKLKLKEEEPFKTKRLGRLRFEERDLDLKLSDELVAHMRQLKPEGNVLDDVYSNMMKRNILEPRERQTRKKRKFKPKTYTKRTHKEEIMFEERDLDLKLSDELVAHMRQLKPEGNVLDDVYSNMMKRNILEPRERQTKKRKFKRKTYTKRTHKEEIM